jgi:hypothetical protein
MMPHTYLGGCTRHHRLCLRLGAPLRRCTYRIPPTSLTAGTGLSDRVPLEVGRDLQWILRSCDGLQRPDASFPAARNEPRWRTTKPRVSQRLYRLDSDGRAKPPAHVLDTRPRPWPSHEVVGGRRCGELVPPRNRRHAELKTTSARDRDVGVPLWTRHDHLFEWGRRPVQSAAFKRARGHRRPARERDPMHANDCRRPQAGAETRVSRPARSHRPARPTNLHVGYRTVKGLPERLRQRRPACGGRPKEARLAVHRALAGRCRA